MISRIASSLSNRPNHKRAYLVFDDEGTDFGCIILDTNGKVSYYHFYEDRGLTMDEVERIDEFMKMLYRIENDEELDTLRNEYLYAADTRQNQSTDKTS